MQNLELELLNHRNELLAFVRRQVGDPSIAEDILQDSLIKALRTAPELRDSDKLIPWLYQIMRNAIVDHYRQRATEHTAMDQYASETETILEPEDEPVLCACFRKLIPTLKNEYQKIVEELDLAEGDPETVAKQLGITRGNLKVRRHRARQQLRSRLEQACGVCAEHGCLDCTCGSHSTEQANANSR